MMKNSLDINFRDVVMKILVNVFVPAIGKKYDILVPDFLRVRTITSLVARAVENLSDHMYVSSGEESLCSAEKNILLSSNVTLEKYGIQHGDHLILL